MEPISIIRTISDITEAWKPQLIALANEAVLKVARLHGEFPWHHHDEDELFLCWDGSFTIETTDGNVSMSPGDVFVVPAGVEHRPVAKDPAHALLLERPETRQYGD